MRDNALAIIELLLDHGADPRVEWKGQSALAMAARAGRGDVLELVGRHCLATDLGGVLRLIAACATNDAGLVRAIAEREPELVEELLADGGELLAEFAGVGNTTGVRLLLDLGVPVDARYEKGDGYFDVAKNSTALHVAAWRAWPATLKLLIERGASVAATERQRPHHPGVGRPRLRGLVLDRQALAGIGRRAACGRSVRHRSPVPVRLRRGGRSAAIARALGSGLITRPGRGARSPNRPSRRARPGSTRASGA